MRITNNLVYENGGIGIICSLDCYDILTENNGVYDNSKTGIMLSRNTHDSIVRNNTISNSDRGIVITESPDNEVHNNVIYNVSNGILLVHPTSPDDGFTTGNRVYNNTVINADNGINVGNSNDNILANNTFQNITSFEYSLENGGEVIIEDQRFTNDKISGKSGTNIATISNSGTITVDNSDSENVDDDDDNNTYDTNGDSYIVELSDETITIESIN